MLSNDLLKFGKGFGELQHCWEIVENEMFIMNIPLISYGKILLVPADCFDFITIGYLKAVALKLIELSTTMMISWEKRF